MNKQFVTLTPKVVLGVAAHPDDLDFGAGGSMAKWAAAGARIYYLILTDGGSGSKDRSLSSKELAEIRQKEQRTAGKLLGLTDVIFGTYTDGILQNSLEVKRDVVRVIRKLQPDVLVTMDPSVLYVSEFGFINHPDHRAAGQAALDAVFPLARDHMSFPELLEEGLEPHITNSVLLINFQGGNYAEDITDSVALKLQALRAHESQFDDPDAAVAMVLQRAKTAGKRHGCGSAEEFMRIDVR